MFIASSWCVHTYRNLFVECWVRPCCWFFHNIVWCWILVYYMYNFKHNNKQAPREEWIEKSTNKNKNYEDIATCNNNGSRYIQWCLPDHFRLGKSWAMYTTLFKRLWEGIRSFLARAFEEVLNLKTRQVTVVPLVSMIVRQKI